MRSKGHITIARNPDRKATGGVIPINPPTTKAPQNGKPALRLKLTIRRLPPGLTEDEFFTVLGEDWKVGNGKIDWFRYRPGKIKSGADHSKQSCAYLRVAKEAHIQSLEATFLTAVFHDAKGSHRDPALSNLFPRIGYAPSQRIPSARQRADARQGTIDQDPEFQAFLVSLTEPVVKAASTDTSTDLPREKITTTPLIEALRLKKTNKGKVAANKTTKAAKETKSVESKTTSQTRQVSQATPTVRKGRGNLKLEDTQKDTEKRSQPDDKSGPTEKAARNEQRRRDRPTAQGLHNIVARDLGLDTGRKRIAKAPQANSSATLSTPTPSSGTPDTTAAPLRPEPGQNTSDNPNSKEPATASKREQRQKPAKQRGIPSAQQAPQKPDSTTPLRVASSAGDVSSEMARAYLKHTNASQGINQENLTEALSQFGEVTVTIDNRKGTGMAQFRTVQALKAAIAQRRVPVAQGGVEVLEFKADSAVRRNQRNKGRNERPAKGAANKPPVTPAGNNSGNNVAKTGT